MKAVRKVLSNGLRVIIVPIPGMESATVTVWVGTGSRYEDPDVAGISHFLEHIVFKGSKKRPSAKAISEAVDGFGGEFNAATSKDWTNFYIKSRVGKLEEAFDVLSDMVIRPLIKEEEVKRERNVIFEEIAMNEDQPMRKIWDVYEQVIFQGNPLAGDVIGTKKSLKNVTRNEFLKYRLKQYVSDNIVLTIAGGVTEAKALTLAKKYFLDVKKGKHALSVTPFVSSQTKPRVKVVTKKTDQAHFMLGYLGLPKDDPDRYVESVLVAVLGGGMSSRMFLEVRERRGLAYAVRTYADHNVDTGYLTTYVGTSPQKAVDAAKVVLEEYEKTKGGVGGITPQELKKGKEYLKGHLALSLEDSEDISTFFGMDELISGKLRTPEEIMEAVDKVTIEDIQRLATRIFVPQRLNFAVIGPFSDKTVFEKAVKGK